MNALAAIRARLRRSDVTLVERRQGVTDRRKQLEARIATLDASIAKNAREIAYDEGRLAGRREERARIRMGVLAMPTWDKRTVPGGMHVRKSSVLSLIDARLSDPEMFAQEVAWARRQFIEQNGYDPEGNE